MGCTIPLGRYTSPADDGTGILKSVTSPAWVEGTMNAGSSVFVVFDKGAPGEHEYAAVMQNSFAWYADDPAIAGALGVPFDGATTMAFDVESRDSGGSVVETVHVSLEWEETDLTGCTAFSDRVVIRKGDSLLLTAGSGGVGTLEIDDGKGGGFQTVPGGPGATLETLYDEAGEFTATAKIDTVVVGTLTVIVMEVDLSSDIACQVGYMREKDVVITPPEFAHEVFFREVNPDSLADVEVEQYIGSGATIHVRPLKRGTPLLAARIGSETGPIVAYCEIDEFTFDLPAKLMVAVQPDTGLGGSTLTVRPYVPGVRFEFEMFASGATFLGGTTYFTINTSEPSSSHGESGFEQAYDAATGETVGIFAFELEIPAGETWYCFSVVAHHPASPRWVQVTNKGTANGCLAMSKNTLIFMESNTDETDPDGEDPEGWLEKGGTFVSGEKNSTCDEYKVILVNDDAQNDLLDNPQTEASFGGDDESDCKQCNLACEDVVPDFTSGTKYGKYDKRLENCADSSAGGNSGALYVARLDANGPEGGTTDLFPPATGMLRKLRGVLEEQATDEGGTPLTDDQGNPIMVFVGEPVIIVSGGDGNTFYGVECDDTNKWTFTAKDDGFDPTKYTRTWYRSADGQTWSSMGTTNAPSVQDETFAPGKWYVKLEHIRISDSEEVAKAEIHTLMVEQKHTLDLLAKPDDVDQDTRRGVPFHLTGKCSGIRLDVMLSTDPGPTAARARVSLDGYPQNEYWGVSDSDSKDFPQAFSINSGESKILYLQGYEDYSQDTADRPTLKVEGQGFTESCPPVLCGIYVETFQGTAATWEWQEADTEPFYVLKLEYVTKGDAGELEPMEPDDFLAASDPIPVVETLSMVSNSMDLYGYLNLVMSGTVTDEISDVVKEAGAKVQSISLKEGEATLGSASLEPRELAAVPPWRPYPFEGRFSSLSGATGVSGPGTYAFSVETSENVGNNKGSRSVTVTVGERTIPGDPGGAGTTLRANVVLPQTTLPTAEIAIWGPNNTTNGFVSPTEQDHITALVLSRSFPLAQADWQTTEHFRVSLDEVDANGDPATDSNRFEADDGSFAVELLVAGTPLTDSDAQLDPAGTGSITIQASGRLFGSAIHSVQAPERDPSIGLDLVANSFTDPTAWRLFVPDAATLPSATRMLAPLEVVYRFDERFFAPPAGGLKSFDVEVTGRFSTAYFTQLSTVEQQEVGSFVYAGQDTEVELYGFLWEQPQNDDVVIEEMWSGLMLHSLPVAFQTLQVMHMSESPDGEEPPEGSNAFRFTPAVKWPPFCDLLADSVQFYYGDRGVDPGDPTLSEEAGKEASLEFRGSVGGTPATIRLLSFTGVTDQIDAFEAEVTYDYAGGAVGGFQGTFTETSATSRRFSLSFTFGGGTGGDPRTTLAVESVDTGAPGGPGSFRPFMTRVMGPVEENGPLHGFREDYDIRLYDVDWDVEPFDYSPDEWLCVRQTGAGDPVVYVVTSREHPITVVDNAKSGDWVIGRDPEGTLYAQLKWSGVFVATTQVSVLRMEIVNPHAPRTDAAGADHIETPAAAPNYDGNEFTFSLATPGVLPIPVQIRMLPDTARVQSAFRNKVRVRIGAIDDSHTTPGAGDVRFSWDHAFAGEATAGNAVYNAANQLWEATATFTGLPPGNNDLGVKTVTADALVGATTVCGRARNCEVFFPRDAINHPDLPGQADLGNFSATNVDTAGRNDSTRSPNWFFYWNQTRAGDPDARFASPIGSTGECPALYNWFTYTGPRERILIRYAGTTPQINAQMRDTLNATNTPKTGIDRFADTILHENRHVTQVLEHNDLDPWDVSAGGARLGWSFSNAGAVHLRTRANVQAGRYNHFHPGPDGQPGQAGVDDDGDGVADEADEFMAGPGDTVVGDDVDLDPDGDRISHLVPTGPDPTPNNYNAPVEPQANAAEITPQDNHRALDWANPGKQHGPDLAAPNPDGEANAYTD